MSKEVFQLYRYKQFFALSFLVRVEGLEPPRREALDPKSSMSTNFITPAFLLECNQKV